MLVLTRKTGEEIVIRVPHDTDGWTGVTEITVKVLEIETRGQGAVKWGITAPKDVEIDRLEVRESKDRDPR